MKGGAKLSEDRTYRYVLSRRWSKKSNRVTFIMLNPSTADARRNDPTIRRCIGFAKAFGFNGLYVANLYALRATDPRDLKEWKDPVGPLNNYYIHWVSRRSEAIILAWGNSIRFGPDPEHRIVQTLEILGSPFHRRLYCLGRTKSGQPKHPLMLKNETDLEVY